MIDFVVCSQISISVLILLIVSYRAIKECDHQLCCDITDYTIDDKTGLVGQYFVLSNIGPWYYENLVARPVVEEVYMNKPYKDLLRDLELNRAQKGKEIVGNHYHIDCIAPGASLRIYVEWNNHLCLAGRVILIPIGLRVRYKAFGFIARTRTIRNSSFKSILRDATPKQVIKPKGAPQ